MAIAKFGSIVTGMRGSIAGVTYGMWRGIPVVSRKRRPVRRHGYEQGVIRSTLSFCARYWQTLTNLQRSSWEDYANQHPRTNSLGDTFTLTALQQFISLNTVALRLGGFGALQDDAPIIIPPASVASLVLSDGLADGVITATVTMNGVGLATDFLEIWVSGANQSPARSYEIQRMVADKAVAGNLLTGDTAAGVIDMWYWVQVRYVDEFGQVTPWVNAHWQAPDVA